jgi:hypothetical protein
VAAVVGVAGVPDTAALTPSAPEWSSPEALRGSVIPIITAVAATAMPPPMRARLMPRPAVPLVLVCTTGRLSP